MNKEQRSLVNAISDKIRLVDHPAPHHTTLQDAMIFKILKEDFREVMGLLHEEEIDNQWLRGEVTRMAKIIGNVEAVLKGVPVV